MNQPQPTHYEVLGLSESATQEQIRKRFRELARRYHPDVAKTPDAAERFKAINEAHRVLSDPSRRATYDAELKLTRPRKEAESPPKSSGAPTDTGARSPSASTRGRSEGGARRASTPPPPRPSPVETLLREAQTAYRRMQFRDAEIYCRQAIRLDRRNPTAYEILGDIYSARGRVDEAIAMYSYVLQLDRTNYSVQAKFNRLVGRPSGPTRGGQPPRASRAPSRPAPSAPPTGLSPVRATVNSLGIAALAFMAILTLSSPSARLESALPVEWPALVIFALLVSGFIGGLLLSTNNLVRAASDELALSGAGRTRRFVMPLGAVLVGFSVVWFYAAFALYMLVGFTQETVSRSILRAFGTSFAVVVVYSLVRADSALFLLLLGGNLVFPAFILGWVVGDLFRQ